MFTEDLLKLELRGLCVQDAVVMLQLIRRLVKSGIMEEHELPVVSTVRANLIRSAETASGVNYDVAFAKAQLATGAAPQAPVLAQKDFLSSVPGVPASQSAKG